MENFLASRGSQVLDNDWPPPPPGVGGWGRVGGGGGGPLAPPPPQVWTVKGKKVREKPIASYAKPRERQNSANRSESDVLAKCILLEILPRKTKHMQHCGVPGPLSDRRAPVDCTSSNPPSHPSLSRWHCLCANIIINGTAYNVAT
jgi:hypothetical protein